MPQIFKIGSFWVYFWSNEGNPLEPVHVHVSEGVPVANASKIWITRTGKCLLAHNNSHINPHVLQNILRIIEARNEEVVKKWRDYFGEISFFC
jgi:hypothetical protein